MSENDRGNLLAILDSISQIENYTNRVMDADNLYENRIVFDATLMNFIVIGKMCERISDELKSKHPEIEWWKIKGFRNLIAHDYLGIDAEEVWQIIRNDILPLKKKVEILLYELRKT